MDKERSQRLAALIEEVADSRVVLDGQNAAFEYVFYPRGRTAPVTRRSDFEASPLTVSYCGGFPRVPPDCRLQFLGRGVDDDEFGPVDVYFIGNNKGYFDSKHKAVDSLRELTARVGRFIPGQSLEWLLQFVPDDEDAKERARCLAWLGRLWFFHSTEIRMADVLQDEVGPYYVGVIDDAFWQLENLVRLIVFAAKASGGGKKRNGARRQSDELGGKEPTLTAKQVEALTLYGTCKGNITEIGRRMGIASQTARQHVEYGFVKLGQSLPKTRAKTTGLPTDKRGQENVVEDDDGSAKVIRNSRRTKVVKDD